MKIPEIVLKVRENGSMGLADERGELGCPYCSGGEACGSWCPHFEVRPSGREVLVTLWCTAKPRPFGALRVVEPENKENKT